MCYGAFLSRYRVLFVYICNVGLFCLGMDFFLCFFLCRHTLSCETQLQEHLSSETHLARCVKMSRTLSMQKICHELSVLQCWCVSIFCHPRKIVYQCRKSITNSVGCSGVSTSFVIWDIPHINAENLSRTQCAAVVCQHPVSCATHSMSMQKIWHELNVLQWCVNIFCHVRHTACQCRKSVTNSVRCSGVSTSFVICKNIYHLKYICQISKKRVE